MGDSIPKSRVLWGDCCGRISIIRTTNGLIYSCVNDPSAPASIDTLYSLKLIDESWLKIAREGLSFVARDVLEKLATYRALVVEKADRDMVDDAWVNPRRRVGAASIFDVF